MGLLDQWATAPWIVQNLTLVKAAEQLESQADCAPVDAVREQTDAASEDRGHQPVAFDCGRVAVSPENLEFEKNKLIRRVDKSSV